MQSYSVSFARVTGANGQIRRYPLLPVLLDIKGMVFHVNFLLDSGSDHSFLSRAFVQDGLGIHIEDLPQGEIQQGLGGTFSTGIIKGKIKFGPAQSPFMEEIDFVVSKDRTIEPNFCLLGREPFFDHYRIDFRMGWRKLGSCGKFTIYQERMKSK